MLRTRVGISDAPVGDRRNDIRSMLIEHRRELLYEIQSRVREVREEGSDKYQHVPYGTETAEADPEDDLAFALIDMKTEMLERVNDAIRKFDEGTYGYCLDCGQGIASSRLRAIPVAVRCRDCEETCEEGRHRDRVQLQREPLGLGSRH